MMAKDNSNVVSLQAARKKAAEEEVRRIKERAAASGRGPLSNMQLALGAAAVVVVYLLVSYVWGGGIQL